MKRRDFIRSSAVAGGSLALLRKTRAPAEKASLSRTDGASDIGLFLPDSGSPIPAVPGVKLPDFAPARWIWYPSGRTLPNTFVLFRRELNLKASPRHGLDLSRKPLQTGGQRPTHSRGPAPSDPRWPQADPVDLFEAFVAGPNVIGATILYYGHGDGTWPFGKPGFLFWLEVEHADGTMEKIVSDSAWDAHLARAWRPGQFKRWYLRALQEEFDANLYPYGWSRAGSPRTFAGTRDRVDSPAYPGEFTAARAAP